MIEHKSEGLAAVLSFFIPGLGQIYNGQIGKGIAVIVISFVLIFSMVILVGFILYPLFWIWSIYDAYTTAKRINAGRG